MKKNQIIKRSTANKIIEDFLNRVENINNNSKYLYKVKEVRLFGSYLDNKERIGDIDIAVNITPKYSKNKQIKLEDIKIKEANRSDKNFKSSLDLLFWPYMEVCMYLKSRKRSISLHRIEEVVQYNYKSKIIFKNNNIYI